MQYIPTSARLLISTMLFKTWILAGRLKNCDHELTVLYGGTETHLAYLQKLIFATKPDVASLGRQPIWKLSKISKRSEAQLAFIPAHETLLRRYQREEDFFIPWWIAGEVSTTIDYSHPPWKKRLSGDFRKIRKYQYGSTVSRNPKEVEHYYHTMYRPLIEQYHGESALPMDLGRMLARVRTGGELLFTLRDAEPVAGELIIYEKGRAMTRTIGVKNADRQLIRQGVISASTLNTIRHVREKGFSRLHMGSCRAFLTDGSLFYKKKWGLRFIGHDRYGHLLRILQLSSGVKAFLENNPFVYAEDRKLWGAVFEGEEERDSSELEARASKLTIAGLQGMAVYRTRSQQSPSQVRPDNVYFDMNCNSRHSC